MTVTREELNQQKLTPVEGLTPAIRNRWSPRAFKLAGIPPADLKTILEAARWAPSSSNIQPWRLLVGIHGSETWKKIFNALVPFNQGWAVNADVLILGIAAANGPKGEPNHYALYDLGQAISQMVVQATAQGLATHSMGGFHHAVAREAFGLGADYVLGAVTAIGYQDEPGNLSEAPLRERELSKRERKPLSEVALTEIDTPLTL